LQFVEPYFSETDIEIGSTWHSEIIAALEHSDIGLIILTPENMTRPWLLFEAGAIARGVGKQRVCPILFDLKKSDVTGPLWHFQTVEFTKTDFRKLLNTINGEKLTEADLNEVFETWWPKLNDEVAAIAAAQQVIKTPKERTDKELLEENLLLTRAVLTEQQKLNQLHQTLLRGATSFGGGATSLGGLGGARAAAQILGFEVEGGGVPTKQGTVVPSNK
jgi:hypothetical protein